MNARVIAYRLVLLLVLAAGCVLPACNTWSGAGRDISSVGHSMEGAGNK